MIDHHEPSLPSGVPGESKCNAYLSLLSIAIFASLTIFVLGSNSVAFENRNAETLDICGECLRQSPVLSHQLDSKKSVAVATQLSGTGNTVLDRNIAQLKLFEAAKEGNVAEVLELLPMSDINGTDEVSY